MKKILFPIIALSAFGFHNSVHAASKLNIHSESSSKTLKTHPYALPCESVQPQSKLLKTLGKEISESTNPSQTMHQFWQKIEQQGTPVIESIDDKHSRLIFLWRNAKHNARLIGGPSNDHEWLTRIPHTDIWFKESIVDNRFMGSYSFAIDSPNLEGYLSHYCAHLNPELKESREQRRSVLQAQRIDPFNPKRFIRDAHQSSFGNQNKFRNENIVALSQAPKFADPSLRSNKIKNDDLSSRLESFMLKSKHMDNERLIQIYKSKRTHPNDRYITAIFFDGQQYSELLNVPKAFDLLVEQGRLPPIQAVFVSHPSDQLRPKELTPNTAYTQFFEKELLPFIDEKLEHRDKNKTVLLGSSLGGLSSAYFALKFPNEISHVVPLSGSFWWKQDPTDEPNGMSKMIRESQSISDLTKQHWYISANSYETSKNNNGLSILNTSDVVAQDLKLKGHDVHYQNYIGGHSYAIWQVVLQDALLHFFEKTN